MAKPTSGEPSLRSYVLEDALETLIAQDNSYPYGMEAPVFIQYQWPQIGNAPTEEFGKWLPKVLA